MLKPHLRTSGRSNSGGPRPAGIYLVTLTAMDTAAPVCRVKRAEGRE